MPSHSEISMPPLASMSLNREPQQPDYQGASSGGFYGHTPPPRQAAHSGSPPAEARIQSWADNVTPQQPKPIGAPVPNVQGMWSPGMGIKFAQPSAAAAAGRGNPQAGGHQQGGPGPAGGTWEPGSGIRFG